MGNKKCLLCTINDSESLEQIFSTYAIYKAMCILGIDPVVSDDIDRLDTKTSEYLRTHCCILSDMYTHSSKDEYLDTFDLILTGSGKRWKCGGKEDVDTCFSNWGNANVRRIAYAPSFGNACDLPLGPKNAVFFALRKYDGIAVADSNTLSILNMEFELDAEKVCNPILLIDKYPHVDVKEINGLFIFVFFEKHDGQKQKVTAMAEEALKYRVLDYSKKFENNMRKSSDEYLNAIEKSSLIITDSAAIMHLAIVYKKPFITVLSRKENESFECLSTLESLGLMERVVYIEDDVREKKYLCRKPIKYGLVDFSLKALRLRSMKWLENNLR